MLTGLPKKVFDFFVFTSLFIACCAVLMTWQTVYLFHFSFPRELAGFVFFGTVCSYNFHWYLTPPSLDKPTAKLRWNISNKTIHLILFFSGLIGAGIFGYLLIGHWFWLGVTAFVTFLYSAPKIPHPLFTWLRKIAIGKTIFLSLSWAHVTTLFPVVIQSKTFELSQAIFLVNRFFFIYAICIIFDNRDVEEDRKAGIKSMITLLSEKGIDRLFLCSMILFFVSNCMLVAYFGIAACVALFIPGIIVALLFKPAKKNLSDYLYYFVLDGLMMLSAPLLLLIKFAR